MWSGYGNSYLCLRTFEDKNGSAIFARQFIYDERGNILEDVLYDDPTKAVVGAIEKNPKDVPHRKDWYYHFNEYYSKTYTYSKDNLMLSEDDGYSTIQYAYADGKDLLIAKYVRNAYETILQRFFYEYDSNGSLITEIVDDGSSLNKNELQGVTERKIKKIINTSKMPIGLPEIVEEKYLDLDSMSQRLLHKTVNKYNAMGQVLKQEHYGADGKLAYTLEWGYDAMGNMVREVNALGHATTRKFDENGNKIEEQGPNKEYVTKFEYDYMNRLFGKRSSVKTNALPRYSNTTTSTT